jgi:hypothetical protein
MNICVSRPVGGALTAKQQNPLGFRVAAACPLNRLVLSSRHEHKGQYRNTETNSYEDAIKHTRRSRLTV